VELAPRDSLAPAPRYRLMPSPAPIASDSTVRLIPSVTAADLGTEMVLLDTASGQYFGLNAVAARVVELVRDGAKVADVVRTLHAEFDVDRTALERDVVVFLGDLSANGLIQTGGS